MLTAVLCVRRSVHVGQERDFLYPQAVNDDMHMNVAAMVMPVRVGAYKGLVAGEMLFTELLPQFLRPVYGQAVVRAVPWVKADDIVVALSRPPAAGSSHSGDWNAYRQRQNPPRRSSAWTAGSPRGG